MSRAEVQVVFALCLIRPALVDPPLEKKHFVQRAVKHWQYKQRSPTTHHTPF